MKKCLSTTIALEGAKNRNNLKIIWFEIELKNTYLQCEGTEESHCIVDIWKHSTI